MKRVLVSCNRRKQTPPTPSATDIGLDRFLGRNRSWCRFSPCRWVRGCATDTGEIRPRGHIDRENGPARCRWHLLWVGLVFAEILAHRHKVWRGAAPRSPAFFLGGSRPPDPQIGGCRSFLRGLGGGSPPTTRSAARSRITPQIGGTWCGWG